MKEQPPEDDELPTEVLAQMVLDAYLFNTLRPSQHAIVLELKKDDESAFMVAYLTAVKLQKKAIEDSGVHPTSIIDEEQSLDFKVTVSKAVLNMDGVIINGLSKSILDQALAVEGVLRW
jgi:hypothetical protein